MRQEDWVMLDTDNKISEEPIVIIGDFIFKKKNITNDPNAKPQNKIDSNTKPQNKIDSNTKPQNKIDSNAKPIWFNYIGINNLFKDTLKLIKKEFNSKPIIYSFLGVIATGQIYKIISNKFIKGFL